MGWGRDEAVSAGTLPVASDALVIRRLGRRSYEQTRAAMIEFTTTRDHTTRDEIWLLEHDPVYTLGHAGRLEHLLAAVDVPVIRTERGGQITYHGPGQLVAYLLVDLRRRSIKVREFVALIEAAVIGALATYNLAACTKPGAPGVYVDRDGTLEKISALGLKIVNGRSFHGLSLNVAMDLTPYDKIDACGFAGLKSIDLRTLGVEVDVAAVGERLAAELERRIATASHPVLYP